VELNEEEASSAFPAFPTNAASLTPAVVVIDPAPMYRVVSLAAAAAAAADG